MQMYHYAISPDVIGGPLIFTLATCANLVTHFYISVVFVRDLTKQY